MLRAVFRGGRSIDIVWRARRRGRRVATRIICCVALLTALALQIAPDAATADEREIGVIKSVAGEAALVRKAAEAPLAVGQSIYLGDEISTGADGAVGFTLTDGSRFSIGPNSAIVVAEFQFQPERGLLALIARLIYGTMAHSTGEIGRIDPKAVQIGTPLGTVGVRGTRFAVKQPDTEPVRQ